MKINVRNITRLKIEPKLIINTEASNRIDVEQFKKHLFTLKPELKKQVLIVGSPTPIKFRAIKTSEEVRQLVENYNNQTPDAVSGI